MEDELEAIIDMGLTMGASYMEARYQRDQYETNLLKNGNPEVTSFETKRGVGVRVIVNGGLGFGATNRLTKRGLKEMVRKTISLADASGRIRRKPIVFSREEMGQAKLEVRPRVSFKAVSLESRMELLKEIDDSVMDTSETAGVKVPGRYLSLDTWMTNKLVMNSDGARVQTFIPRVAVDMLLTALDDQKGSVQRILSKGETSGWEGVERWDLARLAREEVRTLGAILKEARGIKEERCDLVLGPEVVGIVSHESSGHPAEADRILGREAAQAGEAYLDEGSLGMRVGSEVVNVVEDPTLSHSFGYYPFDDEGVKARRRYLIREGRISEFLNNRETAHRLGVSSNASSRSMAYNREPIIRMANTFVESGDHSREELLGEVKRGIYIKNFMEWNIDDRRYNQRYVGLEAYRIEKGEITERVRNPVLEITTVGLWCSVDAVGKVVDFSAGYCGKGDPMQGAPVWMGGPHVRLRDISMGGSS